MFRDEETAKYLGSEEEDGFVSIDFGGCKTERETSTLLSPRGTFSGVGMGCDAEVPAETEASEVLIAVRGSLPETVTVVIIPLA